jgi:hypothetical protein
MIKKGDRVVVTGEANEVFMVIGVEDKSVILHTGFAEPIHKCTVIPKKYHKEIYSSIHDYIDIETMMKIINEDENEQE